MFADSVGLKSLQLHIRRRTGWRLPELMAVAGGIGLFQKTFSSQIPPQNVARARRVRDYRVRFRNRSWQGVAADGLRNRAGHNTKMKLVDQLTDLRKHR